MRGVVDRCLRAVVHADHEADAVGRKPRRALCQAHGERRHAAGLRRVRVDHAGVDVEPQAEVGPTHPKVTLVFQNARRVRDLDVQITVHTPVVSRRAGLVRVEVHQREEGHLVHVLEPRRIALPPVGLVLVVIHPVIDVDLKGNVVSDRTVVHVIPLTHDVNGVGNVPVLLGERERRRVVHRGLRRIRRRNGEVNRRHAVHVTGGRFRERDQQLDQAPCLRGISLRLVCVFDDQMPVVIRPGRVVAVEHVNDSARVGVEHVHRAREEGILGLEHLDGNEEGHVAIHFVVPHADDVDRMPGVPGFVGEANDGVVNDGLGRVARGRHVGHRRSTDHREVQPCHELHVASALARVLVRGVRELQRHRRARPRVVGVHIVLPVPVRAHGILVHERVRLRRHVPRWRAEERHVSRRRVVDDVEGDVVRDVPVDLLVEEANDEHGSSRVPVLVVEPDRRRVVHRRLRGVVRRHREHDVFDELARLAAQRHRQLDDPASLGRMGRRILSVGDDQLIARVVRVAAVLVHQQELLLRVDVSARLESRVLLR